MIQTSENINFSLVIIGNSISCKIFNHISAIQLLVNSQKARTYGLDNTLLAVRQSFEILCLVRLGDERLSANHLAALST